MDPVSQANKQTGTRTLTGNSLTRNSTVYEVSAKTLTRQCLKYMKSLSDLVLPSGMGTVNSRPHKIFLHFHDLWTLLNKIREGVALSPLSVLHKTH